MTTTAVDLFAGAGGLSTGLRLAGATIELAVEADLDAASTYAANHKDVTVIQTRITEKSVFPVSRPAILAGGPPCQGWSTLGHRGDARRRRAHNAAIGVFLCQVKQIQPWCVVLENVRGLAIADGGKRVAEIEASLRGFGYAPSTALLRASDYGVPQLRHRLFIIAVHRDLGFQYRFPTPRRRPALTVEDAIGDLPRLSAGESATRHIGAPTTPLQRKLRGRGASLSLHKAPSHPPHLLALLRALPREGGGVRDLPLGLRPTSGFHNTYARLRSDMPAPAVTSSIGRVSSGRHVHPTQNRALTPREAARLQTFRDSYAWKGAGTWSIYRQIGNAVPPLLAAAILRPLVAELGARI